MLNLLASLRESDPAILSQISQYWQVDTNNLDQNEIAATLQTAMRNEDNALAVWEKLDDQQRGVLQTLISADNKMSESMFKRMHGDIRKMGRGQIEQHDPLNHPASVAEGLFYRGLIYTGFAQTNGAAQPMIYIPSDLAEVLPNHKTGYDDLEALEATDTTTLPGERFNPASGRVEPIAQDVLEDILPADTTIVDDMITLLGYFQVRGGEIEDDALSEHDLLQIQPHLIGPDPNRLTFLFEIGVTAGLVEVHDGLIRPRRADAKRWLESNRATQLKALVDAWARSDVYRELWHIPGLNPEPTGWPYHPEVARQAMTRFLRELTPQGEWWSVDDFIMVVKATEPDFQRPSGDYESWYIRNNAGEYLNGFESWDAVEGPTLEFYLVGPLHWLGLVDLAEDAARLNAYGRAFVNATSWPVPPSGAESIDVQPDGTLLISRRVPGIDRFQAMRFTTWVTPANADAPFTYKLSMEGVQQAAEQGINTAQISAFLARMMGVDALPESINQLLQRWSGGPRANVTLEDLIVLRTTARETLDYILENPDLRRYCGARLGPMAVSVRQEQWQALVDALADQGIEVERL